MQRLIGVLSIIAVIAAFGIFGIWFTQNTYDEMKEIIAAAKADCEEEDTAELEAQAEVIENVYNKRKGVLSFYVRHDDLEKIEELSYELFAYIKTEDFNSINVVLDRIDYLFMHISEHERPGLDMVF